MSQFTRQNKLTNDACYISEQNKGNKSIFDYVTDSSMFINKNGCFDDTPPFLNYIPSGIQHQNIDIENELRGTTRNNTKCVTCKYTSEAPELASNGLSNLKVPGFNETQCSHQFKVLPNGYSRRQ